MAKILIVEDDAILVEMYQAKFELEGHEVRIATNGEECLAILNAPGLRKYLYLLSGETIEGDYFENRCFASP